VANKLHNLGIEYGVPEDQLGVDGRAVIRWESGQTQPNQVYTALLSILYNLPPEQLDLPPLVIPVATPKPVHELAPASAPITLADATPVSAGVGQADDEVVSYLTRTELDAPEDLRYQPLAASLIQALLLRSRPTLRPDVEALANRVGIQE
jgi:hypothetical protein